MLDEAELYLGEAMTYTLFESVKEKLADITADQPELIVDNTASERMMSEVSVSLVYRGYSCSTNKQKFITYLFIGALKVKNICPP